MEPEDLNYEYVEGEGTPIVFIHGWLGSKKDWQKVRNHLELENPMLFYDQRCHGDSECEEFDFDDLADDLHSLIENLDMKDPVLIGHSMGGMVALTYAVRQENYSGLFLIGTSASTPEPENGSPKYFLETFGEKDREEWAKEIVENYVGGEWGESANLAYKELLEATEIQIVCGLESMIDYNVEDKLKDAEIDAVVVSGTDDSAITRDKSLELAELLDTDLIELKSSHLLTFERPGRISRRISAFIG